MQRNSARVCCYIDNCNKKWIVKGEEVKDGTPCVYVLDAYSPAALIDTLDSIGVRTSKQNKLFKFIHEHAIELHPNRWPRISERGMEKRNTRIG